MPSAEPSAKRNTRYVRRPSILHLFSHDERSAEDGSTYQPSALAPAPLKRSSRPRGCLVSTSFSELGLRASIKSMCSARCQEIREVGGTFPGAGGQRPTRCPVWRGLFIAPCAAAMRRVSKGIAPPTNVFNVCAALWFTRSPASCQASSQWVQQSARRGRKPALQEKNESSFGKVPRVVGNFENLANERALGRACSMIVHMCVSFTLEEQSGSGSLNSAGFLGV
jgi:hypothetical protein